MTRTPALTAPNHASNADESFRESRFGTTVARPDFGFGIPGDFDLGQHEDGR